MTRAECEKDVKFLLQDIRDTIRQYDPNARHISMCIIGNDVWAYSFDDQTGEYILDVAEVEDNGEF